MFTMRKLLLVGVLLAALPWSAAQAGGFIGINIGVPIGGYYRPYYGYGGGYYYARPYPYYVAPPTVIVQPAPIYESAAPPVQTLAPVPATVQADSPAPAPATVIRAGGETRQSEIDHCLAHLTNPDERVRADMAIQLGRLKAVRAVNTLDNTLSTDRSPTVRDASARALGLIGARTSLTALDRAAQGDEDRDVRRSAQYAAEVIRGNRDR